MFILSDILSQTAIVIRLEMESQLRIEKYYSFKQTFFLPTVSM